MAFNFYQKYKKYSNYSGISRFLTNTSSLVEAAIGVVRPSNSISSKNFPQNFFMASVPWLDQRYHGILTQDLKHSVQFTLQLTEHVQDQISNNYICKTNVENTKFVP